MLLFSFSEHALNYGKYNSRHVSHESTHDGVIIVLANGNIVRLKRATVKPLINPNITIASGDLRKSASIGNGRRQQDVQLSYNLPF